MTATTPTIRHNGERVTVLPCEVIARIAAAHNPADLFDQAWRLADPTEDASVAIDLTDGSIFAYCTPRNGYVLLAIPALTLLTVTAADRDGQGWEPIDLLDNEEYVAWCAEREDCGHDLVERLYVATLGDGDGAWARAARPEEIAAELDSLYYAGPR